MPSVKDKTASIAYFGQLTWANFVDWLVTFCLSAILVFTALKLGGVRPETQHSILPLYALLLFLHGLWIAVEKERPRRINPALVLFLPFLLFVAFSFYFISPVPWRAAYELTYFFSVFIFLWVAVHNVRTRAHLWVLIFSAMLPIGKAAFIGFYQFFQEPTLMANPSVGYALELNQQYLGQATGIFADPNSFATFLLILLPCVMVAAFVPRLPKVLRVLCFYVGLILVVGVTFTETYWASAAVVLLMAMVPWFCFKKKSRRVMFVLLSVGSAMAVFLFMFFLNPLFKNGLVRALSAEGEGVRLLLWGESLANLLRSPIWGHGGGSYSFGFVHSDSLSMTQVPLTPHNDYVLLLDQYGLLGSALFIIPIGIVIFKSYSRWRKEEFEVRLKGRDGTIMPPQKFFLSIALCAALALLLAACFSFVVYIPALLLYGGLIFAILIKSSYSRTIPLPDFRFSGRLYWCIAVLAGAVFWMNSSLSLASQALELRANQRLEQLVEGQVAVSGNVRLIKQVIHRYEDAVIVNPGNADAWIGLSAAICQLYYNNPAEFELTGSRAVAAASRAYDLCPEYWLSSSQLGVALALSGDAEAARAALERSVEMAPNSSNAHYYLASFLSSFPEAHDDAVKHVALALEINPNNQVARRLQRKLLIL